MQYKTCHRLSIPGAAIILGGCILVATCLASVESARIQRDLRYRQNVAYAYQYRTEQIAPAPRVPIAPISSQHVQEQLLRQVKPNRPVPLFPTRRPMQAVDRLHTRVDINQHDHQHQHQQHQQHLRQLHHPTVHSSASVHTPGTIVAHSHTEVYRKYA